MWRIQNGKTICKAFSLMLVLLFILMPVTTVNSVFSAEEADCDHVFGDWFVVSPATYTEDGIGVVVCTICGMELYDPIPRLYPEDILQRGDCSDEVKKCQEALNKAGYDCGIADGIFGQKTEDAVIEFARDHNLPEDGIIWLELINMFINDEDSEFTLMKKVENQEGNGYCFFEGEEIVYKITLRNNSEEVLSDIEIADSLKGSNEDAIISVAEILQPDKSKSWLFHYTVTAEDVERGYIDNMATATGMVKNQMINLESNKTRVFTGSDVDFGAY